MEEWLLNLLTLFHFHDFVVFLPTGNLSVLECFSLYWSSNTTNLQKYTFCIKLINCPRLPLYVCLKQLLIFSQYREMYIFVITQTLHIWQMDIWLKNMNYLFRYLYHFSRHCHIAGGKLYLEGHLVIDHWELCEQCYFFLSCSVYTHWRINMLQIWEQ